MGYIGNSITQQVTQPATQFFSGNGSTTSFTLNQTPQNVFTVEVVVNNVQQNPQTSFYINGNTLIFYNAPPSGTNNIYINYNPIVASVNVPGYATVGNNQLGNITNIASGANNFTLQTGSVPTTALTVDQNQRIIASVGYGFSGGAGFEKYVGAIYFTNGTSNLAVNLQFGNIATGGMFEVSITSTYSYQNSGGGIKKIYSILTNPGNNIYTNESRVTQAIGPIVSQISIGEFTWDSASSQYIIPISHLVSTGNPVYVFLKVISPSNGDSAFTGATLGSLYTLSPLSRNYEYFNNPVGFGTTQPQYQVDITGTARATGKTYLNAGTVITPTVNTGNNGGGSIGTYVLGNGKYWDTSGGAQYIHILLPSRYNSGNSKMWCLEIKGYDYGGGRIINLMIAGYVTPPSNGGPMSNIATWDAISYYSPTAYYSSTYSVGVARFYFPSRYFSSFVINSIASGNGDIIEPNELTIIQSASATL